jgi:hypothetical protein
MPASIALGDRKRADSIAEAGQKFREEQDRKHAEVIGKFETLVSSINSSDKSNRLFWILTLIVGIITLAVSIISLTLR